MKCDELCVYKDCEDFQTFDRHFTEAYKKSEVDAAIAELKSENERLNRELEHVKNGDCINTCDVVEKHVKEEIKAKRALWLARKAHAVAMFSYWDSHYIDNPNAVYRNRTVDWLRNRWLLILDAIIKKEKEYK